MRLVLILHPHADLQRAMGLALLVLGFIWGSSFILMKIALFASDGTPLFPALDVAMGRIAIAGLALAPIAYRHRHHLSRHLALVGDGGGIGNLVPAYLFTTAQTLIPPPWPACSMP